MDPYLQALDDVAAELVVLQQRGPDFPAFHRGQILEQLGILAGKLEELRRRRQAPAQDPGPVPSDWTLPDPRLDLMRGFHQLATGEPPTGHHRPIGEQVEFGPPRSTLEPDPVAEDRAEWDAAPRW